MSRGFRRLACLVVQAEQLKPNANQTEVVHQTLRRQALERLLHCTNRYDRALIIKTMINATKRHTRVEHFHVGPPVRVRHH